MDAPAQIRIINYRNQTFWARFTNGYDWKTDTYLYRVQLPEMTPESGVIVAVAGRQLSKYCRNRKPVRIIPLDATRKSPC